MSSTATLVEPGAPSIEAGLQDRLPLVVAITGHHDVIPSQIPALTETVRGILRRLRARYPKTPLLLLTSLSAGAERIGARVACEEQIRYRVPLPVPETEFRKQFDSTEDVEFVELLQKAESCQLVPDTGVESSELEEAPRRAHQRALVGAYIARVAHVFIALWNGKSTEVDTGRIVAFRLDGAPPAYLNRSSVLDAPETGPVYQVVTGRLSDAKPLYEPGSLRILVGGDDTIDERTDPLARLCESNEAFNTDLETLDLATLTGQPIEKLRAIASRLAVGFQTRFARALRQLFVFTGLAAVAFALFAHVFDHLLWLVYVYAAATGVAVRSFIVARRGRWQDRALEYRMLEMGLRVQRVWDLAGLGRSVADHYLRRQRSELDWIRDAIRTVHVLDRDARAGESFDAELAIQAVRDFVNGQHKYFVKAAATNEATNARFERLSNVTLWLGGAASLILIVSASWLLFARVDLDGGSSGRWLATWLRDVPIVAIALITIVAALLHEYPQRNAFHAQARRYFAMSEVYERAQRVLEESSTLPLDKRLSIAQDVALDIGREALGENVEWGMLHRELPIDLLRV